MRILGEGLRAALESGATHLCRCWLLVRRDGQRIGFTDHDRDLVFGADTYFAGSGLSGSAVETATGLATDNAQVFGALSAAGLLEADILAGRYDRAEVVHYLVDWQAPQNRILQFRGRLGEIERGAVAFEAELRGVADDLNKAQGRAYVPGCDRALGDGKCGVALEGEPMVFERQLLAQTAARQIVVAGCAVGDSWFARGYVTWASGPTLGLKNLIRDDHETEAGRVIELWDDVLISPELGAGLRLVAGCDKRSETCRTKFDNLLNFRGFPHIPGDDWVTAVPEPSAEHNGGKLIDGR